MKEYQNPEVLRKLYWGEGLSLRQTASKFSVSNTDILKFMRFFNIPRRSIGSRKFHASREDLRKLYWMEKLSLSQIAKKFGVCGTVVFDWMKKFNIPRREPARSIDRKELLFDLYINQKLSISKIAQKLDLSYRRVWNLLKRYGIKTRSISETSTKYPKTSFSGDLKEKAYMIGLRASDLSARKSSNLIEIRLATTHRLFIEVFKELFEKYSHISETLWYNQKTKETIIRLSCLLDKSFDFILEKPQKIPQWILSDTEIFFYYLAGYVDGDGYWSIRLELKKYVSFKFGIDTMDKELLQQINKKLEDLGFFSKFGLKCKKEGGDSKLYRKDIYYVTLSRRSDVIKLGRILLPLSRHKEKIWKMNLILKNIDRDYNKIDGELTKLRNKIKETVLTKEENMQQLDLRTKERPYSLP